MYSCLHMYSCVWVCVYMCGGQRTMSCVFFNCFLPEFFEPRFLIEPEAHQLSRLTGQWASKLLLCLLSLELELQLHVTMPSLELELQARVTIPAFLLGSRALNSGPHARMASKHFSDWAISPSPGFKNLFKGKVEISSILVMQLPQVY